MDNDATEDKADDIECSIFSDKSRFPEPELNFRYCLFCYHNFHTNFEVENAIQLEDVE